MAPPALTPSKDRTIVHQDKIEKVIDKRIELDQTGDNAKFALQGTTVVASPAAVAADLKVAVDAIRAALTAAKITA